MKARACLAPAILALCCGASAQTTESGLKALYGEPVQDTFLVRPDVQLHAVYGPDHKVCVLTISGPISERELMRVFDTIVPVKTRGLTRLSMIECMGVCRRVIHYENVEFTSGVIDSQVSDPAESIVFKRKDCEAAANEQVKTGDANRDRH
jgi:hypothetical protein